MPVTTPLGAPGIYEIPESPVRALTGVRMDVCAFVGVAVRGPARVRTWKPDGRVVRRRSVATEVESWDDFVRLFGSFEAPSRLAYAVSAFFDQGGIRAYVVRVVHDYADQHTDEDVAVAHARLAGLATSAPWRPVLRARNEGAWGNTLSARLDFTARTLAFEPATSTTTTLALPADSELPAGSTLRIRLAGGGLALRIVSNVFDVGLPDRAGLARHATLDDPLVALPGSAEIVEGTFTADDGQGRFETHGPVGLSPAHPRYLLDVIQDESELVEPDDAWFGADVLPAAVTLPSAEAEPFQDGLDRYPDIVPEDFLDADWVPGDEFDDEFFPSGVQCLLELEDLSLLVVPDLYEPTPVEPIQNILTPPNLAGPTFERCADRPRGPQQHHSVPQLAGLMLDPVADFETIVALQQRLADLATYSHAFVALLDVPPGLADQRMLDWRSRFGTAFAAAYHPWLKAARLGNPYAAPVTVNPSASGAGIVAQRELSLGVPFGPANELAAGMVDVVDRVSAKRHDVLHQSALNVFLKERDGVRLSAARTLSRDPDYRQLSVRRLVTMIERTLERELQWLVFENNTEKLRDDLRQMLVTFLRDLYRANAFVGASEAEAFFVRCDETLNTRAVVDAGRLLCEIGIAPAEPLEFIMLQIARDGDGTLRVGGDRV
jgi:hypothetical protein